MIDALVDDNKKIAILMITRLGLGRRGSSRLTSPFTNCEPIHVTVTLLSLA